MKGENWPNNLNFQQPQKKRRKLNCGHTKAYMLNYVFEPYVHYDLLLFNSTAEMMDDVKCMLRWIPCTSSLPLWLTRLKIPTNELKTKFLKINQNQLSCGGKGFIFADLEMAWCSLLLLSVSDIECLSIFRLLPAKYLAIPWVHVC